MTSPNSLTLLQAATLIGEPMSCARRNWRARGWVNISGKGNKILVSKIQVQDWYLSSPRLTNCRPQARFLPWDLTKAAANLNCTSDFLRDNLGYFAIPYYRCPPRPPGSTRHGRWSIRFNPIELDDWRNYNESGHSFLRLVEQLTQCTQYEQSALTEAARVSWRKRPKKATKSMVGWKAS